MARFGLLLKCGRWALSLAALAALTLTIRYVLALAPWTVGGHALPSAAHPAQSSADPTECRAVSPLLVGPCPPNLSSAPPSLEEIRRKSSPLSPGGAYSPPECRARHRSAIVVPYRDRSAHLRAFLDHLHLFLQRQQIEYRIYVVEQWGRGTFNRGKLLNAGVREALRDGNWSCVITHDVDLLPEDDRNTYGCDPLHPTHMSAAVDKFHYVLPYVTLLGGVVAATPEHFTTINGYSNRFWGWGGEDDDLWNRFSLSGMKVVRRPMAVGRYKMIVHTNDRGNEPNPRRENLLRQSGRNWRSDGLSSINYKVLSKKLEALYTKMTVDIGEERAT
ncbi:beta-1,4-galactosyltransferase 3-like isoform X2 [Stigmatopora argus]